MSPILALTIWPEWAWAICHLDKRVENRGERFARQIDRRVGDGWLAIHAGKSIMGRPGLPSMREGLGYVEYMAREAGWRCIAEDYDAGRYRLVRDPGEDVLLTPERVVTSAIVALAQISDVLEPGSRAPWKVPDSAALALSPMLILPEPIACKGKQGLWTPPHDVQERLRAALEK